MKMALLQVRQRAGRQNKKTQAEIREKQTHHPRSLDTKNLLPALRQWHDRPQNTLLCGFARLWLRGLRLARALGARDRA
jgi:hypothetical protein